MVEFPEVQAWLSDVQGTTWAAWFQAVISAAAILAAVWIASSQGRRGEKSLRKEREEVVRNASELADRILAGLDLAVERLAGRHQGQARSNAGLAATRMAVETLATYNFAVVRDAAVVSNIHVIVHSAFVVLSQIDDLEGASSSASTQPLGLERPKASLEIVRRAVEHLKTMKG
ncbi:hypothetical protein [Sabulicella rubraurantiaca]|uniref:hypothetical protein n=1 Tax=Sabulicella rubraurantiaca TaxID=2811429 RepID=UPI001A95AA60|nr:hypothetical protein [Sabulicella rubraurantiaca]